ncbi:hypothetical protein WA158_005637 [Blastocystis sp. Blastoise]
METPSEQTTTPVEEVESTETYDKIYELLTKYEADFKVLNHRPTHTSQESAEVRGTTLESGAKAMLVHSKKTSKTYLLVISAAKSIDWKKVKKILGAVELVPYDKVPEYTGCLSGGVAPFGRLLGDGFPTYMDESLEQQGDRINFNGLRTRSINLLLSDYIRIERPIIVNFSK